MTGRIREEVLKKEASKSFSDKEKAQNKCLYYSNVSQVTLMVKNLPANAGDAKDTSSILGLGTCP